MQHSHSIACILDAEVMDTITKYLGMGSYMEWNEVRACVCEYACVFSVCRCVRANNSQVVQVCKNKQEQSCAPSHTHACMRTHTHTHTQTHTLTDLHT
jgi:hypothetical protein